MKKRCPICKKQVFKASETSPDTNFFPFCSERCKLVDLNAWFEGKYVISSPVKQQENDDKNISENMLE